MERLKVSNPLVDKKDFSNNKRFITDFQLKLMGKQYHLSVASSLAEIKE